MVAAGEGGLVGGLEVDGAIALAYGRCGVVIVVAEDADILSTVELSTVDDGLSEGVVVEVVERHIIRCAGRSGRTSSSDLCISARSSGECCGLRPAASIVASADRTDIDIIIGEGVETGDGGGMAIDIDDGACGAARNKACEAVLNLPSSGG